MNIKNRVLLYFRECGGAGLIYIVIPAVLLICELFVRIFCGGTALIYRTVENTGIFPGAFLYMFSYILRTVSAGIITAYLISNRCITENRIKLILISIVPCILLLFEYKLIFVSIRLVSSLVLSVINAAAGIVIMLSLWQNGGKIRVMCVLFSFMQTLFCIQTVSLIFNV